MKKVLFALFAVAALASCSNTEVVELNREQIAFGDTFVNNATKADYSTDKTVDAFKVYGTVTALSNTTQIFNGNNVTRGTKADGEAWACDGTAQYWLPNASYSFAAIVDGGESNVTEMPETINFTVADGANNKDLLYATANVTTNATATPDNVNTNGVVAFNFSHLLSRVYFDITDANTTDNYTFKVTNIKVDGVQEKGIYTVGAPTPWAKDGDTTTTLNFANGTGAGAGHQILPVEQTLAVTISYETYLNSTKVSEATKTATIPAKLYAANTCYKVSGQLSLAGEIQFTISQVIGFSNGDGITLQ